MRRVHHEIADLLGGRLMRGKHMISKGSVVVDGADDIVELDLVS